MKKKLCVLVACVLLCVFCFGLFGCDPAIDDGPQQEEDKLILFLGDSIAEAVLGPTPIIERENYGYYALVGRRSKGYYYRNRSVSGHQTSNMADYITKSEGENAMLTQTYIKKADIICVSIIGNDVLQNQFDEMFLESLDNSFVTLDGRLSAARDNIDIIVKYLRQANPNATLILQTVYNPIYSDTPMVRAELREKLAARDVEASGLRALADVIIERMNDVLRDYLRDNPGAYYLLDVNAKFDEYFDIDEHLGATLIYPDGTHPSNIGHAVIADLYQEYLEFINKTDHDYAVDAYKQIKNEQLDRMFDDVLNVTDAKAQINACTTCPAVTEKYFELINGKRADYSDSFSSFYVPESEKEYFAEDRTYSISAFTVLELPIKAFLSSDSYMKFYADGTFDIKLKILPSMIPTLNDMLASAGDLSQQDLAYWADLYAAPLFPDFSLDDPVGSFSELNGVYVYLDGFDMSDPYVASLNDYIAQNHAVPDDFHLPDNLGVSIKGKYSLHTLVSEYSGEHKAVFIGDYTEKGEPLFVLSEGVNDKGKETILLQFMILNLRLLGTKKN